MKAGRAVKGLVRVGRGFRVRCSMASRQEQSRPWQLGKAKGTGSAEQPGLSRQNQIKEATGFHNPGSGLSKRNRRSGKKGLETPFQRPPPGILSQPPCAQFFLREESRLGSQIMPECHSRGGSPTLLLTRTGTSSSGQDSSSTLPSPYTDQPLPMNCPPRTPQGSAIPHCSPSPAHPPSCHHPGPFPSQSSHQVEPPWFPLP